LTPAADIYSLAKTAYTLICGVSPRQFAHEPITELPEPIASKAWASSLLHVLRQATQKRPQDRYQTVQDFWDDLNDVTMPVTQPLVGAPVRSHVSADLNIEPEVLTLAAPPRPRFETSRELKQHEVSGNGGSRPRIVVPIAGARPMPLTQNVMPASYENRVTVPVAQRPVAKLPVPAPAVGKPRKRSRDFVVGLILVLCFAGLLAATGAYVRSWIKQRANQQTTTTTNDTGRQATTTTDVNLRAGPNSKTDIIGLAESGSRVKVLDTNSNSNWCEVQVLQHSRPKDDPASADRGWVNRTFLKFD
jgi:serine/threonine protein kinase